MEIKNLIDAIAADNAIESEQIFDQIMSQRVGERIDDYRQEVARNMFASITATGEEAQEDSETQTEEE